MASHARERKRCLEVLGLSVTASDGKAWCKFLVLQQLQSSSFSKLNSPAGTSLEEATEMRTRFMAVA